MWQKLLWEMVVTRLEWVWLLIQRILPWSVKWGNSIILEVDYISVYHVKGDIKVKTIILIAKEVNRQTILDRKLYILGHIKVLVYVYLWEKRLENKYEGQKWRKY